jgi:hypothetical protein
MRQRGGYVGSTTMHRMAQPGMRSSSSGPGEAMELDVIEMQPDNNGMIWLGPPVAQQQQQQQQMEFHRMSTQPFVRRVAPPSVPGVSAEERNRRFALRLCLKCGMSGHRIASCRSGVKTTPTMTSTIAAPGKQ